MTPIKHPNKPPTTTSCIQCLIAKTRPIATNNANEISKIPNNLLLYFLIHINNEIAAIKAKTECPEGNDVKSLLSSGRGSLNIFLPKPTTDVEKTIAVA